MSVLNYSAAGSNLCLPLWFLLLVEGCKFDKPLQLVLPKMWSWHFPALHCRIHQFHLVLHKHTLFPRISFFQELGSRDNVVRGSNSGTSSRFSLSWNRPDRLWSPHTLQLNGYRCYFQGVRWPGYEANCSPLRSAEVKMSGAVPLLLLCAFMARTGTTLYSTNPLSFGSFTTLL